MSGAPDACSRRLGKLPEPASYEGDAAALVAVLRRWYGDEAHAIARRVVEQLEADDDDPRGGIRG